MSWTLALPLLIPFVTAIAVFLLGTHHKTAARVSLGGSLAGLAAALLLFAEVASNGVIAGQMGGWPAPFGITLVADMLSAIMVVITAITAVAVALYALGEIGEEQSRLGYHALFQVLIAGVTGAFITGDLFNLYVWFEVMLIASFGLLVLGGRPEQSPAGRRHQVRRGQPGLDQRCSWRESACSTVLTGTLNLADLHGAVGAVDPEPGSADHRSRSSLHGRLRHQGGALPAVLLAAGLVSHAAGGGLRGLRRPC